MTDVTSGSIPGLLLGTAQLGLRRPRRAWQALVGQALDGGFAGLDTAPSYGDGLAERVVGAVLRGHPVHVQTKVGLRRRFPVKGLPRPLALGAAAVLSRRPGWDDASSVSTREGLERQWAGSRRRLGVDRVDVLLLHEPDPSADLGVPARVLVELQQRGLVGRVGVAAPWATCKEVVRRHPELAQVLQLPASDLCGEVVSSLPEQSHVIVHSLVSWANSGAAGARTGSDLPCRALDGLRDVLGPRPASALVATTDPQHAADWSAAARRTGWS